MLRQTLEQLQRLEIPAGLEWELVVVNNNCTDQTDVVLIEFKGKLPLRRVFEPKPGLSEARNAAVREARGERLVWTDDDVLVAPGWLAAYVQAFASHPEAAFFGGPIEPWFEGEPPAWLLTALPRISGAYAIRDLGNEAFAFDAERLPYGANFSTRRATQLNFPYDPNLGFKAGATVPGEEVACLQAMLAAGHSGWWVPGARVRHFLPQNRQNLQYLYKYFFGQGLLLARQELAQSGLPSLRERQRAYRKAFVANTKFHLRRIVGGDPKNWVEELKRAATQWGRVQGWKKK